jgi:hypothetical protein
MRLEKAQKLVNSLLDIHIQATEGANRAALEDARSDLLALVGQIVEDCASGVDLDAALTEAAELTRRDGSADRN